MERRTTMRNVPGFRSFLFLVATLMAAGATARGQVVSASISRSRSIETLMDGRQSTVNVGGRPVLVYRYADTPFKAYVSNLLTPGGINILRDAPVDHLHHHGLMYALTIDGTDFWGEFDANANGKEIQRTIQCQTNDRPDATSVTVSGTLDWRAPDGKMLAHEKRAVTLVRRDGLDATLLNWRTELSPAEDRQRMEITGHHYFGLGMRFVESMDQAGRFMNEPDDAGETVRGSERLSRGRWCAYVSKVDGKPVTVAMFDHPDNPRPAYWFTMTTPFAYLSATLNEYRQRVTVLRGEPLRVNYGVAVWDGERTKAQIEAVYESWLQWSNTMNGQSAATP